MAAVLTEDRTHRKHHWAWGQMVELPGTSGLRDRQAKWCCRKVDLTGDTPGEEQSRGAWLTEEAVPERSAVRLTAEFRTLERRQPGGVVVKRSGL